MLGAIQAISNTQAVGQSRAISMVTAGSERGNTSKATFGQILGEALDDLNQTAQRSDSLAEAYSAGADVEIHDVILAMQETQIAFELAAQVRNRAVEAYQEIMRLQL